MRRTLNAMRIRTITKPGRYGDGGNLYLRVSAYSTRDGKALSKSWVFRYAVRGSERARERFMGFGSADTLSLADARERARQCRLALLDGLDPIDQRRDRKRATHAAAARSLSFKECAEAYIREHRKSWKSATHAKQWGSSLERYCFPIIGGLNVADIDTPMVLRCVRAIWDSKPETARRLRGRIELVLDAAKAGGFRQGENVARWKGHLDKLLVAKSKGERVRHFAAMPYSEVPGFMAELAARGESAARALELTILCAARTGEMVGARWSEIDLREKLWTIAGDRMKSGRGHIVPLSDRAVSILKALPRVDDFVFPGVREGRPISPTAMLELLRELSPTVTVHGFRSTFRDWAGDTTNFAREVIEGALAHQILGETEASYRRSPGLVKRRRLMVAWATFCAGHAQPKGMAANVIALSAEQR
jgi:integrase